MIKAEFNPMTPISALKEKKEFLKARQKQIKRWMIGAILVTLAAEIGILGKMQGYFDFNPNGEESQTPPRTTQKVAGLPSVKDFFKILKIKEPQIGQPVTGKWRPVELKGIEGELVPVRKRPLVPLEDNNILGYTKPGRNAPKGGVGLKVWGVTRDKETGHIYADKWVKVLDVPLWEKRQDGAYEIKKEKDGYQVVSDGYVSKDFVAFLDESQEEE